MSVHVDYPHHPGTLHGCGACEDGCFCDGSLGGMCISCHNEFYGALYEEEE